MQRYFISNRKEEVMEALAVNRHGIGGNFPPNDSENLKQTLGESNADMIARARELYEIAKNTAPTCEDEETASLITDRVKMIASCKKSLEAKRVEAKEPYLTLERTVDGYFKPITEGLDNAKRKLESVLGVWLQRKAAEERRRREEEAARQRQEAEAAAVEAARLEQQAREAHDAEMQTLAAASQKQAEQKLTEAVVVEKQAVKSEQAAQARPSQLAATHGDYGSRSSLRTVKVARIVDRAQLGLGPLGPHLSEAHIQIALNSWMKANWVDDKSPPELAGASFTMESRAQVR
jgi:hypothetical protein